MNRVPFRRAALSWLAASTLLAGVGCLDDRGVGPGGTSAHLAVRAQFGAAVLTGIRLEGGYLRTDQSSVAFAPQTLPIPADRTPGMEATMPLSIDLAQLQERLGQVDGAVRTYEDWLRREPRSLVAANNLAMLLITHKSADSASLARARI